MKAHPYRRLGKLDKGTQYYEERYQHQQIELLRKKAAKLGLQIVKAQPA